MNSNHFQIFALVYLILYLGSFFLPLILLKRRGIDVKGTMERITGFTPIAKVIALVGMLWLPMVILYAVNAESISWFLSFSFLDNDSVKVAGVVIAGISFPIMLLGMVGLGENFRIILPREKTELVTNGIYRYIRNPLVLSIYILALGMFLFVPNLLMLAAFICSIFQYKAKIKEEQRWLLQMHGPAYEKCKKDTGKYFPKVRRSLKEDN